MRYLGLYASVGSAAALQEPPVSSPVALVRSSDLGRDATGVAGQEGPEPPPSATARVACEIFINPTKNFSCREDSLILQKHRFHEMLLRASEAEFFLQKMLYVLQLLGDLLPQTIYQGFAPGTQ